MKQNFKQELRNNISSIEKETDYIEIRFNISELDNELIKDLREKTIISDTVIYYFENGMTRPKVMTTGNNDLIDLWFNDFLEHIFKTDYTKYNEILKDLYFDIKSVGDLIAIKEGFEQLNY